MTLIDGREVTEGMRLPDLELPPITRTTLALFAGASGDHNPIHIDIDAARAAGLDDVFAHGMLSMAYLGRFLTRWVPQERIRRLAARFVAMTPVGARPTITGAVTAVEETEQGSVAVIDMALTLDDGTTVTTGTAHILLDSFA